MKGNPRGRACSILASVPNVGPMEIVIVLVIALLVLGPKRLPEMGKSVGRGMREFRNALSMSDDDEDDEAEKPGSKA
jgi:sec-independent protein translocase protein TatA